MSRDVIKQVKALRPGDLCEVLWYDASKGEARVGHPQQSSEELRFDVPVRSWGIFLGIAGKRVKHVILLRDAFQFDEERGEYDIDYNSIPLGMIHDIRIIQRHVLNRNIASMLERTLLKHVRIAKQRGRKKIVVGEKVSASTFLEGFR